MQVSYQELVGTQRIRCTHNVVDNYVVNVDEIHKTITGSINSWQKGFNSSAKTRHSIESINSKTFLTVNQIPVVSVNQTKPIPNRSIFLIIHIYIWKLLTFNLHWTCSSSWMFCKTSFQIITHKIIKIIKVRTPFYESNTNTNTERPNRLNSLFCCTEYLKKKYI